MSAQVRSGVEIPARAELFGSRFLFHLCFLGNSAMMSTLTAHYQWEDETVRERTGHPPSYAEAKKFKSLKLHTHGCPRASLRYSYSSSCSSNSRKYMMLSLPFVGTASSLRCFAVFGQRVPHILV